MLFNLNNLFQWFARPHQPLCYKHCQGGNKGYLFSIRYRHTVKIQFQEKKFVLPIEKFPSLVLPRNVIMSQHLIIQFLLYYLSSGRLREVKNKRQFQTCSSKSGRGSL